MIKEQREEVENLEDGGRIVECGKSDKAKQSQRAGQSREERTMGAAERNGTRKEAKLSTEEPKKMKIRVSDESREADAESKASGLEKEDINEVKGNEESETQMIRNKAVKRWANKMQKRDGGEDTQAKDFKDGTTEQPVALMEDCLNIQGGFSLHYLFL